jgi:hypothetical protein
MCNNIPYTSKEMEFIHAIFIIDPNAKFKVVSRLETRDDYKYGAIEWEDGYMPIPYEHVAEVINENIRAK